METEFDETCGPVRQRQLQPRFWAMIEVELKKLL